MDSLTVAAFKLLLGSKFRITDTGAVGVVDLLLADIRLLGGRPVAPRREPFALEFMGPAEPLLPQRTYRLEHDQLGDYDIFLVPIGRDPGGGVRYEAVFN